jgi:general secretion pathway protein G
MTTQRPAIGSAVTGTGTRSGFAVVDFIIGLAILLTLLTLAVPVYNDALESAKMTLAARDIDDLQEEIERHRLTAGSLPGSLHDLDEPRLIDPWGHPYHYTNVRSLDAGAKSAKGRRRLDRFLKAINSGYDLYSCGPDGKSAAPLTARTSRDDIVRARDGLFVGVAEDI